MLLVRSVGLIRTGGAQLRRGSARRFRVEAKLPDHGVAVNLVSMTARSFGTVKSGNRAPKLVAMTELTGGKDAGDGF